MCLPCGECADECESVGACLPCGAGCDKGLCPDCEAGGLTGDDGASVVGSDATPATKHPITMSETELS